SAATARSSGSRPGATPSAAGSPSRARAPWSRTSTSTAIASTFSQDTCAMNIDEKRLLLDLDRLAQIGRGADGGITRRALSVEDAEARRLVKRRMAELGLEIRHDEVGNLRGRRRGRRDLSPVMTGSHLDSVPSGGRLDGPLGVVGALAAVE